MHLIASANAVWILCHDIDGPAAFAGIEPNQQLASHCAYCLRWMGERGLPLSSVGVTCPEPAGIGPFDYGQLVRVEVGGRLLHGEIIRFDDEPDLEVPGEWSIHLPICSARCNLLLRALARADVVRELRRPSDLGIADLLAWLEDEQSDACQLQPEQPVQQPSGESDLTAVWEEASARLEQWIEGYLSIRLDACGWCGAPLNEKALTIAEVWVDGDDTRCRRPMLTAVRMAHRLVPALPVSGAEPDARLLVAFCGHACHETARHAVEAAARRAAADSTRATRAR